MITIKLPIQNQIDVSDYLREFNSCVRYSYNRFCESCSEKDIKNLIKLGNMFPNLDSWFVQCAIKEGQSWYKKNPDRMIFGGKKNFKLRSEGKITNEEWKQRRLHPLCIQGDVRQKGNRKFDLDVIDNNQVIFKPYRGKKVHIDLPKLRKNYRKKLFKLEELSKECKVPFTVRLSNSYICITYDEALVKEVEKYKLFDNRVFSIDLNPNYIGYSILKFDENNNFKIINSGVIDNSKLNEKLEVSSNHPDQVKQNNKKEFETFEVSKFLVNQSKHFRCSRFIIEDLNIRSTNHQKGRNFNRLVNNCWNKNELIGNLRKRCNIHEIQLVQVNPAYSSYVGNIMYGTSYPDMVASSIEIGRRGYKKFAKNWFYPSLPKVEDLRNLWKEAINWTYENWKELALQIKTSKMSYRSSLNNFKFKVFRLNNIKSKVYLYSFS